MAVVDAIGVFGTVLTTVGFWQSQFGEKHNEGPTVVIKAGLPELKNEADSLGGSINNIYAFDERNGYAGQSDGCQVDSGGICEKTIDAPVAGRRAGYVGVSNNNDATCIAWITVEQFDQTSGGAWTGDIGYHCGQSWYNSVESAGMLKEEDGGGEYIPKCTWIDADHTNDILEAALKFDVKAYGEKVTDTKNNDACAPTIFGPDNGPISDQPGKRGIPVRPEWMTDRLIISTFSNQPAEELCSSNTSWGPDFIGPDGRFCDMESKTSAPLCSSQNVDGCVEVDEEEKHIVKRTDVARRSVKAVHKSYKTISKWGRQADV